MKRFIARHTDQILGVLSGFDRLVFRGHLCRISYAAGMTLFLNVHRILFKNLGHFVYATSERLKKASYAYAEKLGRPIVHVASSKRNKEEIALGIANTDGITEGLVALLKCVEPCSTFGIGPNPKTNILELRSELGQCLHLYYYWVDPTFGWMNARIQTWFPFNVQICLNGREWLARQMDAARLPYRRRDNCFPWIENFQKAQKLMDRQLKVHWPQLLDRIARRLNPIHSEIFRNFPADYYWSVYQSEWATDLAFKSPAALQEIYPALVHHAITSFGSADVMRFLGRKVHGAFKGEIVSDFTDRPEGVRVKHWVGSNSIKLYDKQQTVLRPETTIQDPAGFKVFRPKQGASRAQKEWLPMRKGIADLYRRAEVSQAANERYLDALASVDTSTPLSDLLRNVCRPATYNGKRLRGLRPWSEQDVRLFEAVNRGEFAINGLRNRDLQPLLFTSPADSAKEKRRRSARVSHFLRLLRAHGILHKIPKSHRYKVTPMGRDLLTAVLAAHKASVKQLTELAA